MKANPDISSILWNPQAPYCAHKSLPLIPSHSQISPVHMLPSHFSKIKFNIIFPSTPTLYTSLSCWVPHHNPIYMCVRVCVCIYIYTHTHTHTSLLPCMCCMSLTSHPPCNVYTICRQTQLSTRRYANLLNVNLNYMFRPQSLAIISLYERKLNT